jgi:hypothetical protein
MSSEDEDDEEDEEAIWAEESYTTRCVTQSLTHSDTQPLRYSVTLSLTTVPHHSKQCDYHPPPQGQLLWLKHFINNPSECRVSVAK